MIMNHHLMKASDKANIVKNVKKKKKKKKVLMMIS